MAGRLSFPSADPGVWRPSRGRLLVVVFLVVRVGPDAGGGRAAAQPLLEPLRQRASGVMAARPEELVASGDFHEDRDAAAGGHWHPDERHPQSEQLVEIVVDAEALVFP